MSSESGSKQEQPFLTKQLIHVIDNNGSPNYSRNQVQFETISLSNNGKWADYRDGFISLPLVFTLTRDANASIITPGDAKNIVQMKASNLNIIDSIQIDLNNQSVVQQTRNIAPLLVFKQHTTYSLNDVEIHGHTTGYRKDSSEDWSYVDEEGMKNNNPTTKPYHDMNSAVISASNVMSMGGNCQQVFGLSHVFYYDCIIRLKDLPFFEKMPMVRGANVKITLTLNQFDSEVTVASDEKTGVQMNLKGSYCPLMRCYDLVGTNKRTDYVETLRCDVVTNGAQTHTKNQCRLYVPCYTMPSSFENQYVGLGSKKVLYTDVYFQRLRNIQGGFQSLLTNSLARMKRLVIIPMLSASANGTLQIEEQSSPYSSSPSTTAPHFIQNFNVALSGTNVYQTAITYKYESFLDEMDGAYGVNAGKETGVCSSLISLKDYESNYGYIVVDLSRRYAYDEMTPLLVQISGTVASPKALDLFCYIEYEKDVTISLSTGQILN
jgi:hypothetical protein